MENQLGKLYSKWRQQAVEIKAGELKEVYFDNTNPNMFFVSNFSDAIIYGGLTRIPTFKSHEFRFRPHKQKPFGVPLGKRVLYLLNLSPETVTVDVYSTEMPFDLNVLQDFSVDNVTLTADDPVSFSLAEVEDGLQLDVKMDQESKNLLVSIKAAIEAQQAALVELLTTFKDNSVAKQNEAIVLLTNILAALEAKNEENTGEV